MSLSTDAQQQPLQILSLGKIQRNRMIRRTMQPALDTRIDTGIQRRAGDDFLEQVGTDAA